MKLIPMTPNIKNAPISGQASLTPLSKKERKNNKQNITNMPVLIIGTSAPEIRSATTLFLFLSKLNTKPATKPAIVVLSKQARTVPTGLIGIKIAKVDGDNKAIKPLKKPTTAPERGPHIAAASTIVIKDKLMLTGPNCK